jgi:hypothetical protein
MTHDTPHRLGCALAALALLAACSDDDDHDARSPADAATPARNAAAHGDAGGGDAPALFGGFTIKFVAGVPATASAAAKPAYTSLLGKLLDAEAPEAIVWELADAADGCELRTPRVPFCEAGCGGTAICTEDDRCTELPASQDVGEVKVSGLGPAPFGMEWVAGNYQAPESSTWPYPPCSAGEPIDVGTEAGAPRALALEAACIEPLETEGDVAIETGKPLALTWTAPPQPSTTRMHVELDISHHGGAKGVIDCDVDDDGAFAVPASLVDQLVALGVAGFPTALLSRVASDHGDTPETAHVSLLVSSSVERPIAITGLTSCAGDGDCGDGETCQPDATCK